MRTNEIVYDLCMKLILIIIALTLPVLATNAEETCSRLATINYQDVLIDPNTSQKGEGLRYFLEKDAVAKNYLDEYQRGTQISWKNALLGSAGSAFMITSLFVDDSQDKKIYLFTGATMVLLNFLVSRTLEVDNEQNLIKAIDEYNQRNLPKIYFNPQASHDKKSNLHLAFGVLKNWTF